MKRFGYEQPSDNPTQENDIFLLRLHLLIVMVKAAIKGYPVGEYRKKAALDNAALVHQLIASINISFLKLNTSSHLFKERVKLLTVMATAIISDDYPLGIHRREAVLDNIEMITEYAFPDTNLELFPEVLKVA
ncbi:MAG: hypothetical protein L3J69_11275 [Desulfobacula sp.]|nr:hypothetical protein [Desulfobacula sp.]